MQRKCHVLETNMAATVILSVGEATNCWSPIDRQSQLKASLWDEEEFQLRVFFFIPVQFPLIALSMTHVEHWLPLA